MRDKHKFYYYSDYDFINIREYYVGEEALQLRGVLKLISPFEHEITEDWVAFEHLLDYSFYSILEIDPSERIILFCPPYNLLSRDKIEKVTEVLFETFNIKGLCIINPGLASLTSMGKNTGTIVYLGNDIIQVSNFFNGKIMNDTVKSANYGFQDLVNFTRKKLLQKGYSFTTSSEKLWVEDICNKFSYIALEPERELQYKKNIEKDYICPDGKLISIKENRFEPAELFFKPEIIGKDGIPIHKLIYESHSQIDDDLKNTFKEVILTGIGVIPGMDLRLKKELNKIGDSQEFKVKINPFSTHSEFKGASILGQNKEYLKKHVYPLEEFKDFGPQGIHEYY